MTMRYTKDHEYIRVEGDTGIVGITDYAQSQLGEVVYVELPEVGKAVSKGGEVVAVNGDLEGAPGAVNEDPAGKGWFLKIRMENPSELEDLMTEEQYQDFVKTVS